MSKPRIVRVHDDGVLKPTFDATVRLKDKDGDGAGAFAVGDVVALAEGFDAMTVTNVLKNAGKIECSWHNLDDDWCSQEILAQALRVIDEA